MIDSEINRRCWIRTTQSVMRAFQDFPGLSAQRLFDETGAACYTGAYNRVRDDVGEARPGEPVEEPERFETPGTGGLGRVTLSLGSTSRSSRGAGLLAVGVVALVTHVRR